MLRLSYSVDASFQITVFWADTSWSKFGDKWRINNTSKHGQTIKETRSSKPESHIRGLTDQFVTLDVYLSSEQKSTIHFLFRRNDTVGEVPMGLLRGASLSENPHPVVSALKRRQNGFAVLVFFGEFFEPLAGPALCL